ncbi:MAG TPA: rod-binding protein, partial [Telluria sp.]|nr:rod-binding protein [Telluria sp.]
MRSPTTTDISSRFALDTKGLGELKQSAKAGAPEALKSAATQFEAMFINMMMKSMRDATPQDGMLDNQQTKMFTSMLDQQTSQN